MSVRLGWDGFLKLLNSHQTEQSCNQTFIELVNHEDIFLFVDLWEKLYCERSLPPVIVQINYFYLRSYFFE